MTIDKMLEVLNAYKRGEKIEYRAIREGVWQPTLFQNWNFQLYEYRIAKPEPKKIKLQAWFMPNGELVWCDMSKVQTWSNDAIRIHEEDKEITLP